MFGQQEGNLLFSKYKLHVYTFDIIVTNMSEYQERWEQCLIQGIKSLGKQAYRSSLLQNQKIRF